MCIIVVKPTNKSINEDTLKECFINNPHGAGYSFVDEKKKTVQVKKGFMSYSSFISSYRNSPAAKNNALTVFHFRISTCAVISGEYTHPFPIWNKYEDMTYTDYSFSEVLFHNGIFPGMGGKDYSDTMEFTKKVIYPVINHILNNDKQVLSLVNNISNNCRIVIMTKDSRIITFGKFFEKDGIFYSNESYKPAAKKDYTAWDYYSPLWNSGKSKKDRKKQAELAYFSDTESKYCPFCYSLMESLLTGVKEEFFCENDNMYFTSEEIDEFWKEEIMEKHNPKRKINVKV